MPIEFFQQRIVATEEKWVLGAFERRKLVGVVGFVRDSGIKTRHKGLIWGMYVLRLFARKESGGRSFVKLWRGLMRCRD